MFHRFLPLFVVWTAVAGAQDVQVRTYEFDQAAAEPDLVQPTTPMVEPSGEILFTAPRGEGRSEVDRTLERDDLTPLRRAQLWMQRADAATVAAYELLDRVHGTPDETRMREQSDARLARARADYVRASELLAAHLRVRQRPYTRETGVAVWTWLHLLQRLENHDDALRVAGMFISECADCPLVANAHVLIADRAFERMEMTVAREAYLAATRVRRGASQTRAYAYYKLGWLHLNLSEHDQALEAFREVRRLSPADGSTRVMHREAGRDYVRVLATTGRDAVDLIEAVQSTATEPESSELLDRLEARLREQGREPEAAALAAAR